MHDGSSSGRGVAIDQVHPAARELVERFPERRTGAIVQARERIVEHEEPRRPQHGAGQEELLRLPVGELEHAPLQQRPEPEERDGRGPVAAR